MPNQELFPFELEEGSAVVGLQGLPAGLRGSFCWGGGGRETMASAELTGETEWAPCASMDEEWKEEREPEATTNFFECCPVEGASDAPETPPKHCGGCQEDGACYSCQEPSKNHQREDQNSV